MPQLPHLPPPSWHELAPRGAYARLGKPLLDLGLLAVALPVGLVLALPIAAINTVLFGDPRRIFFVQERVGRRGEVFRIFKFRTMRAARRGNFASLADGEDDLRVTRFGRFLRCAHLDELPQIVNVLCGHMSFIGPRPEMIEVVDWARRHVPGFDVRHALKPGITGHAQTTLGYTALDARSYAAKLGLDERYRREFGLVFDLRILARTAVWMLRGRGWRWHPVELSDTAHRRRAA